MSFNRLTIQSLQAERQRAAYTGLGALGSTAPNVRPTVDYVRAGDVLRVYIAIDAGLYFGSSSFANTFVNRLKNSFNVLNAPTAVGGGIVVKATGWVIDVQPRSDYSKLRDAVSVVLGDAQAAGLNVNAGLSYGQFISKVEDAGVTPPVTLPAPATPGTNNTVIGAVGGFFDNLTQSPVTLAVILGAAVILVIAAKK